MITTLAANKKNSQKKTHLSNLQFFHENCRFLDVSETQITGGSLILGFIFCLSKYWNWWFFFYSEKFLNNWNRRLCKESNNRLQDTGSPSPCT
jgi:hypothetical protein